MNMNEIVYRQPKTEAELTAALSEMTEKSRILAGGTDILIEIRSKRPEIDLVVSLWGMNEWKEIREEDGWLRIGALATHDQIDKDERVRTYARALAMACHSVGSQQVRNKGTIGGSIGNNSPAGDMMPNIFLLHGEIELLDSEGNCKRIPAEEYLDASGRAAIQMGEAIKAVWIPICPERDSCFVKLGSRREVTIAQIDLCLAWTCAEGEHKDLEMVMGAVDRRPLWIEEAADLLRPAVITDEAKDQLAAGLAARITAIRQNRKRPPKLKITEAERLYKERAVKGVLYDVVAAMEQ